MNLINRNLQMRRLKSPIEPIMHSHVQSAGVWWEGEGEGEGERGETNEISVQFPFLLQTSSQRFPMFFQPLLQIFRREFI